ncbi:PREDICTED: ATP synthase subunit s-like protein [Dufourea novaeangliae]|uniref:ATP synthase subunit s-like protein n=1 Tax=Dufourea novaeangliae TaxID=178035 RepID=UPI0007672353|nr:PREDICTED: ATP synthase subunit s-like protein [Dufourea novaeangliae]
MLVLRSTLSVTKILDYTTFHQKLYINIVRGFYNDRGAISFLLQNLRTKRTNPANIVYKEKKKMDDTTYTDTSLVFFSTEVPQMHNFFTFHTKHWLEYLKKKYITYAQNRMYKENLKLGSDLASAKCVLKRGGRVKFYNQDWIEIEKGKPPQLPTIYDPQFVVEAIDLKGFPIQFETIDTICNLFQLRWMSLRGCKTINDWAMDKIVAEFPALEYLDVSECINVTERGLEALYKLPNLKKLIITNFYHTAAFELTCVMLEDINSYLKCEIREPEKKLLPDE